MPDGKNKGARQQNTGDGSEAGADRKCHRDRLVDVDAHKSRSVVIFRHSAHRFAHLGLVDEQCQADHDHDAGEQRDYRFCRNRELSVEQLDPRHTVNYRCEYFRGASPDQKCAVLKEI